MRQVKDVCVGIRHVLRFDMKHGIASDELFDVIDPWPDRHCWPPSAANQKSRKDLLSKEFVDKRMAMTPEEPLPFDPAMDSLQAANTFVDGVYMFREVKLTPSPPPTTAPNVENPPLDGAGVPTLEAWLVKLIKESFMAPIK